jgi:hypothetical protein
MNNEIRRGYIVEVIGTPYNGQNGYVTNADYHSAVIEFKDGSIHNLLKSNLKVVNGDTEIEYGEDSELIKAKEKYVKGYLGYPENYLRTWTEEDIRKVIDKYNQINLRNKNIVKLTDYELAGELQRTIGGVQWLRRRVFQKESTSVVLTGLIKKLKDEFGLI